MEDSKMSDDKADATATPAPDAAQPPPAQPVDPVVPWEKIWATGGPYIEKIVQAAINAMERSHHNTGQITGLLLGLIIVSLTGFATLALLEGRVDTAEKVIIALVSFLGGAAMFSGSPKK
jgi:hypothetical protein